MAPIPKSRQSYTAIKEMTEQHIRLCRLVTGTEQYLVAAENSLAEFTQKNSTYEARKMDKYQSTDRVAKAYLNLDDAIRTAFENCKQYERLNEGKKILLGIFPEDKFGHICHTDRIQTLSLAKRTAVRFAELGEEHPLYNQAGILNTAINTCITEQNQRVQIVQELQVAKAELDLAREMHIFNYQANYFNAVQQFGRKNAERLFPKSKRHQDNTGTDDPGAIIPEVENHELVS